MIYMTIGIILNRKKRFRKNEGHIHQLGTLSHERTKRTYRGGIWVAAICTISTTCRIPNPNPILLFFKYIRIQFSGVSVINSNLNCLYQSCVIQSASAKLGYQVYVGSYYISTTCLCQKLMIWQLKCINDLLKNKFNYHWEILKCLFHRYHLLLYYVFCIDKDCICRQHVWTFVQWLSPGEGIPYVGDNKLQQVGINNIFSRQRKMSFIGSQTWGYYLTYITRIIFFTYVQGDRYISCYNVCMVTLASARDHVYDLNNVLSIVLCQIRCWQYSSRQLGYINGTVYNNIIYEKWNSANFISYQLTS